VNPASRAAPLALIAIGAGGLSGAFRYGWWDAGGPGAGLLPGVAGIALCVFSLIALLEPPPASEPAHRPRLAGYVVGLAGFAWLMDPLGAVAAIVVLFAFTLGIVERWPWRRVVPIAVGAALFAWVLFDRLLQVPLPGGVFFER